LSVILALPDSGFVEGVVSYINHTSSLTPASKVDVRNTSRLFSKHAAVLNLVSDICMYALVHRNQSLLLHIAHISQLM